ncbi:hypothetical protein [Mycobacteroides saopaulense]|uniref:Restriction alleviation protein, Lar family n=1 Tax=Mycobacteroides saopaulense TaxID=1578165 RepID=A0ABX3BYB5_9MYCO|nr:hypothetical protein [Mycobacteroides saopaulense]OHT86885.1 hypothetical protein BKG68_12425 [Mycobacteroides saopaulense]OHU08740.1 hypothetical protein BKG73_17115 [Mycobacteroides saopaulense]
MSEPVALCPFCSSAVDIELYNGTYGCDTGCEYVQFTVQCPTCKRTIYDTGSFGSMDSQEDETEYRERYMAEFAAEVLRIKAAKSS